MTHAQNGAGGLDGEAVALDSPQLRVSLPSHPDQRQGWRLVIGLAVVLGILFGTTLSSFGVFTLPLTRAFDCTHEQAAQVASAFILTMTLAMPLAGWLLDCIGPRSVMTTGAAMTALGYLLAASSPDIDRLTLAIGLSGIGVGASTYVPAIALIMRWIDFRRQGLALGILLSGGSVGAIVFPVLLTQTIETFGWRGAMQSTAALVLLICVPLLLWLARLPEDGPASSHQGGRRSPGLGIGRALRLPRYWLWVLMQILLTLSILGMFVTIVPYLVSAGYSARYAAAFFSVTSAAGLAGHFVFGLLSSRWNHKPILMIGALVSVAGILCLLAASDPVFGVAAIVLFALAWGSTFNLVNQFSPLLLEQEVGPRNFGALLGIGNLIAGLGSAFSPKVAGFLVDVTGSYAPALLLCAAFTLAALLPIALQRGGRAEEE